MRTTVTLDPDVLALLRKTMQERGVSFKDAVNEAIRKGLTRDKRAGKGRFVQPTYSLGAEQYFRWDKALAVAEAMEDEELSRKLALRK
jgi:hypothetical protein